MMDDGCVIYGPCPGCDDWTLEVARRDEMPEIEHRDDGAVRVWEPVASPWVIDAIMREHAVDCEGLRAIVEAAGVDLSPS